MKGGVNMLKKIQVSLLFLSLAVCLCMMSNTYSRYVVDTTGNVNVSLAKWQILVNDNDITANANSNLLITPVIEKNENIAEYLVAPTSKGYFDIDIDPSNVELSFNYSITLGVDSEDVPDLIIAKYAIITEDMNEEDIASITLDDSVITDTLLFDNSEENFEFKPFTIRVYFEWYDGVDKIMTNEEQVEVATKNSVFNINANISFGQVV